MKLRRIYVQRNGKEIRRLLNLTNIVAIKKKAIERQGGGNPKKKKHRNELKQKKKKKKSGSPSKAREQGGIKRKGKHQYTRSSSSKLRSVSNESLPLSKSRKLLSIGESEVSTS